MMACLPNPTDLHHLFVVRASRRDELMNYLKVKNIETKIHWAQPLHRMQATWANTSSPCPCTDAWSTSILSLPCYPGLMTDEITRICVSVQEFFEVAPQ